ncbi:MAG: hypothetical protein ACU0CA_17760 [Paracoccaceae bacterium]
MIKLISGLSLAFLLSGCGADGYPTEPKEPALSISGETYFGVVSNRGAVSGTDLSINFGV